MARQLFAARVETFGLDTAHPWALDAFRLLFHTPRAYEPLVAAWDQRHPGTRRAVDRLAALGFVAYQPGVVIDTTTGAPASAATRKVQRYRTTGKGTRLVAAAQDDLRVLEDAFPRTARGNLAGVLAVLEAVDLEASHARFGLSSAHTQLLCGLPSSNVKWWLRRLIDDGYVRELPDKVADTREIIPAHWRVTRALCRQLGEVIRAFDSVPDSLRVEFRLGRTKFLTDIDPARVGISGATDFDHDTECQRILAAMLRSDRCVADGIFAIEPKIALPLNTGSRPWSFDPTGPAQLFYQPDAELRERDSDGLWRSLLEYERFQSRRDAWNHIERFLGWMSITALPSESAVLRFVVDSTSRERSYVALIESYADYALDHRDRMPANTVVLAVSSTPRVLAAADPLAPAAWYRIPLPVGDRSDTAARPVLHPAEDSPYDQYFGRRS
jgi:hypothetical protein